MSRHTVSLLVGLLSAHAAAAFGGTIVHYSFDGNFLDDSGNNNHGGLVDEGTIGNSGFVPSPAPANYGQAWDDNDDGDRLIFTTPFAPGPAQAWTVSFWYDMDGGSAYPLFDPTSNDSFMHLDAGGPAATSQGVQLRLKGQGSQFWREGDFNLNVSQGGFHHYALVVDPSGLGFDVDGHAGDDAIALYVDGQLTVLDGAATETDVNLSVGGGYATDIVISQFGSGRSSDNKTGIGDELWVFDEALTGSEVLTLMNSNTPPVAVPEPASLGLSLLLGLACACLWQARQQKPRANRPA